MTYVVLLISHLLLLSVSLSMLLSVYSAVQRTGAALFRMTGDVIKGSATTLIWTLQVLRDSTVISGDSRGQVIDVNLQ